MSRNQMIHIPRDGGRGREGISLCGQRVLFTSVNHATLRAAAIRARDALTASGYCFNCLTKLTVQLSKW